MTSTFEITSAKSGKVIRFEATYVCKMIDKIVDADGYKITAGAEPSTAGSNLVVYVDGKKADSCRNPEFWRLIDIKDRPGCKKIWGLGILFTDPDQAAEYEAWIGEVMEAGTDEAVQAYRAEKKAENDAEQIELAERVVNAAEKQADIPTAEEAKRRMQRYNDIHNEGGEGYVPHVYNQDEYSYAVGILKARGLR